MIDPLVERLKYIEQLGCFLTAAGAVSLILAVTLGIYLRRLIKEMREELNR